MSDFDPETDPRRPEVTLVGVDGNAFSIMGHVARELRKATYSEKEIKQYRDASMASGDYGELLRIAMKWAYVI